MYSRPRHPRQFDWQLDCLLSTAEEYYKERHIRFKPQFCTIDAYTEPHPAEGWPPPGWDETREEALERMRNL